MLTIANKKCSDMTTRNVVYIVRYFQEDAPVRRSKLGDAYGGKKVICIEHAEGIQLAQRLDESHPAGSLRMPCPFLLSQDSHEPK